MSRRDDGDLGAGEGMSRMPQQVPKRFTYTVGRGFTVTRALTTVVYS